MAQSVRLDLSILKALDQPSTCTNDILLSIKSVLSPGKPERNGEDAKENVKTAFGHSRARSLASTAKVTATTRRTKTHTRQLTAVDVREDLAATSQEKVNYAFRVINSCIKSLSQLAKEHVLEKRAAGAQAKSGSRPTPVDAALKPKSPNTRRFKTIDEVCIPTKPAARPVTIAMCACTALAFLQTHYAVANGKDSTNQVENGMLAVIAKCIDLELAEIAVTQLQALQDRLMEHVGAKVPKKHVSKLDAASLVKFMDFPAQIKDTPVLTFAVKLQQHAWQILALAADPTLISATVEQVLVKGGNQEHFALLLHWATQPENQPKAARHVVMVSRLLLQLSTIPTLPSKGTFILRCSAFSLQLQASQLGNSIINDEAKDLASKLGRCLEAFYRSSELAPKAKYTVAIAEAVPLSEELSKYPACMSELAVVRRQLSQLATVAGEAGQAKRWAGSTSAPKVSVVDAVRLATNELLSDESGVLLQQAAAALHQSVPGDKSAADRLLVEVVGLRRATHKAVSDNSLPGKDALATAIACVHFLRTYLSCSSDPTASSAADSGEKLRIGRKFARPFISTVIVSCLHQDVPDTDLFVALKDSCTFFSDMCAMDETFAEERFSNQQQPDSSIFVTMFKLCHRIWNQRTSAHGPRDEIALAALKMSVDVLGPWTNQEKESVSYLQQIRYLIDGYIAWEEWLEAHLAFKRFLREFQQTGYADQITKKSNVVPLHQLRGDGSHGALLHRSVRSFVTIALRIDVDKQKTIHLESDPDPSFHGILLEWQLEQLASHISQQQKISNACRQLVQQTVKQLLEIYDQKMFPVRRLRVAVATARLLSTMPDLYLPGDLLTDSHQQFPPKLFANDAQLARQYSYLATTLHATVALLAPHADDTTAILKSAMDKYDSIARSFRTMDDVYHGLDGLDAFYQHLKSIADLYALRRDARMEAQSVEILLRVLSLLPGDDERRCEASCRLALIYTSLGYTGKAKNILMSTTSNLDRAKMPASLLIRFELARAEYFIAVHEHENCEQSLRKAAELSKTKAEENLLDKAAAQSWSIANIGNKRLVAKAAYLSATLELRHGHHGSALRLCVIAKCMLFKIWSSLEHHMPCDSAPPTASPDTCPSSDGVPMADDAQPVVMTRSYSHLSSVQLRELVPDLLDVARLELSIHDFRGAYHDAFAVLKHANRIANHVGGGVASLCDVLAADLYTRSIPLNNATVRADKIREARARIDMIDDHFLTAINTADTLEYGLAKARLLSLEEEAEGRLQQLRGTMDQLKAMIAAQQSHDLTLLLPQQRGDADALADQLALMKLEQQQKTAKTAKGRPTTVKTSNKRSSPKTASSIAKQDPSADEYTALPLENWHGRLLRDTVLATLDCHAEPDIAALGTLVESAGLLVHGKEAMASQSIARAQLLFHRALSAMATDITFNAVQDSIIAVPSPQQLEDHELYQKPAATSAKAPRKGKATTSKKTNGAVSLAAVPEIASILEEAYNILRQSWDPQVWDASVMASREHGQLISRISLMAAVCAPRSLPRLKDALVCAYHSDMPSIRAKRLNQAIEHPDVEKLSKDDLRAWPSIDGPLAVQLHDELTSSSFQAEFIDIIPAAWNVVSLTLTDGATALKLVRYRSHQPPLVLRVPFSHREPEDPDDEVLDMSVAYARLRAIIKQHEFAPADATVTDKSEFKRNWWQKKHNLDASLRNLLYDVESQWFTAVKGAFSSQSFDPEALSRLRDQLQNILVQQCPTKKAKGKAKSSTLQLNLEPCIVELFIGLGDPNSKVEVQNEDEDGTTMEMLAETATLGDGIHDLVRLAIESLQFSGERIAIDEIEMDNVIVKVIDALKDYYAAIAEHDGGCQHTILVLDNQLHGFPWESLPCLRNQSVSRLPSLADLRDRISTMKLAGQSSTCQAKVISRSSGTSLLNPSGDLAKTAQRFQPWLHKLPPQWAHLRTAPDDEGWRHMLTENELFLYVGHGSTSQYVRPRIVKRLGYQQMEDKNTTCAVSWLIGCGSVAVEDLGEFEPSGMVLSYLAAGSPAVLGALWDVGDIDADYFSITAGDYWGLWDEANAGLDAKLIVARKKIVEEKKAFGRNMNMCEAVARSRGGCKLPHLNGAAFVVYGIPVVLD